MAVKAYEPRAGNDGLVVEAFVGSEEFVSVGGEDHPWPYATGNYREQQFLDAHPLVKTASVEDAESNDPEAEAVLLAREFNATEAAAALAVENEVDLLDVDGSGAEGRITVSDVQQVVAERADEDGEEA